MNELTKKQIENNDISALTKSEQDEILAIKDGIELSYSGMQKFGVNLDKKYSAFSSSLLETIKMKDNPEVEQVLTNLLEQLDTIDVNKLMPVKETFFSKLFKVKDVTAITTKYRSVQDVINDARKQLETTSFELKKDVELCEMHLQNNLEYIREINKVIVAGKLKLEEEKREIQEELLTVDPEDTYNVSLINQRQYEANRLERKIFDHMLKKEAAVQTIREITIMRENYASLTEQIDSSIQNAIPLWETHMFIAIQLIRQQNGLKIQNAVSETTNKLFETNMAMLKANSIGIAKSLETGFIDYEVLKKVHSGLIETITEIKKIHEDGSKKRAAVMKEIEDNNKKVNEIQLLASNF